MKASITISGRAQAMVAILMVSGCMGSSQQPTSDIANPLTGDTQAEAQPPAVVAEGQGDGPDASVPAAKPADTVDSGTGAVPADLGAATVSGATANAEMEQTIDTVLGDHKAYRDVFDRLQRGVAAGDKVGVAALVDYPIHVRVGEKPCVVRNAGEFVAAWDRIITPDIAKVITEQRFENLFVNPQGVMFGDGQIWINAVCRDNSCSKSDVRVVTIQSGAGE